MKLYHGTDNTNFELKVIKEGKGYHPGAGPVEFLGPSFSDNRDVASSYGKIIIEKEFTPKNPKKYRSLKSLRNKIIKIFGLPQSGQNLSDYYRDIADSFKAKLLAEGYDSIMFEEGLKNATDEKISMTVIPLSEDFFIR